MALYLLVALLSLLPLTALAAGGLWLYRLALRARLGAVELRVEPRAARPGDKLELRARVAARGGEKVEVSASLECTLFDHRARRLFARRVVLAPGGGAGGDGELVGELVVPRTALGTGIVGDELSTLFSEEARRLLAFWTVVFEVRPADRPAGRFPLLRRALPVEVTGGRQLSTDERFLGQLVVDTFAALKDDLVFNWLVKLAAHDGSISAAERELLHELLRTAHGVTDPAAADARIDAERDRKVDLDPELVRRHVPVEQRVELYKLMFALAWRDGVPDPREHQFLLETLSGFGLDRHHVREVELEVLRGAAAHSMQ